jgi:hypothetical protein
MAPRSREEERQRAYRSGYDEGSDFEPGEGRRFEEDRNFDRTLRAPFREYGRAGARPSRRDYELERSSRMHFEPDRAGGYGEAPRYEYSRYGGHGPRSDYEFGYGGFQRFGDPYGFESTYARTPEAAYPMESGREGYGQVGEFVGSEFDRGAERSAFGWHEESKRGIGPKNYARTDERILEDVCDELTEDPILDASEVEVKVADGEVTLSGTVEDRAEKRRAEDDADRIIGVRHVQNNLRVVEPTSARAREVGTTSGTAGGNVTGTVAPAAEPTRERTST